jgi:hypothetical protein
MRRSVAAVVVALSAALSITSGPSPTSSAATGTAATPSTSAHQRAVVALHRAQRVVSGRTARPEGTMALLDLRLALPRLTGPDRRQALGLLARPTDHPDVNHEAYRVPAKKKCSGHICIHWVPTTSDAPPSKRWVNTMLTLMNNVWHYEVDKLGYLPPLSDGQRGGDARYDVYLKELFDQGLYGLSVPERPSAADPRLYSGYLVIDNDFARSQFGAKPIETARVTAAHEFFHAIQFRYDVIEDRWLMESSATWMEDQFADESNDNRQYLTFGQLAHPNAPLDTYRSDGFQQYGNWPFYEYLSEHYGRGIVRSIWDQAAAFPGGGHQFSAHAVRNALRSHGGLTAVFARYAAGNLDPARTYQEGAAFPASGYAADWPLSQADPGTGWRSFKVHHLASQSVRAVPDAGLTDPGWGLRLRVDAPSLSTSPAAYVRVVRRHGPTLRTLVHLNDQGGGQVILPFSHHRVRYVTVTLANASVDYHGCFTDGAYSCGGRSDAPHPTFRVKLTAFQR